VINFRYIQLIDDDGTELLWNGKGWCKSDFKPYQETRSIKLAIVAMISKLPPVSPAFRDPASFAREADQIRRITVIETKGSVTFSGGYNCIGFAEIEGKSKQSLVQFIKEKLAVFGYTDEWIDANIKKGE
jgi:hypothetical protein